MTIGQKVIVWLAAFFWLLNGFIVVSDSYGDMESFLLNGLTFSIPMALIWWTMQRK